MILAFDRITIGRYVGFKLIDPSAGIGFDLSSEYAEACKLHGSSQSGLS